MNKNVHEGEKLMELLRKNGYKINRLVSKLSMSHTTFYRKLKHEKLPADFVKMVGKIIDCDSLPQLLQTRRTDQLLNENTAISIAIKCIALLENHLKFFTLVIEIFTKELRKKNLRNLR